MTFERSVLTNTSFVAHDLGHNLGLAHGGDDDGIYLDDDRCINCKPNYLSIMNYQFVDGLIVTDPDRLIMSAPLIDLFQYRVTNYNGKSFACEKWYK
jgi:hypothetical protein